MRKQEQSLQQEYTIDLALACPRRHSELDLDDVASTEPMIEEVSALALNTLFDTVLVETVEIKPAPTRGAPFIIVLRAQGIEPLYPTNNLAMLIEDTLTCALSELFASLYVEHCAVA